MYTMIFFCIFNQCKKKYVGKVIPFIVLMMHGSMRASYYEPTHAHALNHEHMYARIVSSDDINFEAWLMATIVRDHNRQQGHPHMFADQFEQYAAMRREILDSIVYIRSLDLETLNTRHHHDGSTMLMSASHYGHSALVKQILFCDADPLIRDYWGRRAYDYACGDIIEKDRALYNGIVQPVTIGLQKTICKILSDNRGRP